MRNPDEIAAMVARFEDDIRSTGWDPSLDAASAALQWALGDSPTDFEALARDWLKRPAAARRRDWLARGGNPDSWD